jgi:hypothetical protein
MKNIKIYKIGILVIVSLFSTVFSSCNEEEFLTENPKAQIFADNLFVNKSGFMFAISGLNRNVADERAGELQNINEAGSVFKLGSDWGITNLGFAQGRSFAWYTNDLNPNAAHVRAPFQWLYGVVNASNLIIARAENSDVDWEGANAAENEANKNYVIAHAKLVWAWAYRHLTYLYGDVPISRDEISGLTYRNDWVREPVADIRLIMEDYLLFAEEHLLDESDDDPTLLTKAVARHYLAELYLAMDDPAKAEQKALLIANDSRYALITQRYGVKANQPGVPFMDQFYQGNVLRSQGNTEVLWAFITAEDVIGAPLLNMRRSWVTRYDRLSGVDVSEEYGGRGLSMSALTAYAFDVFNENPDDDRFSEFAFRKYWVKSNGDTITAQTSRASEPTMSRRNNYRWSHTRKWDGISADPNNLAGPYSWVDQPYIRLAETYLLLAEAQFKLGNSTGAAEWINRLRRRANTFEIAAADVDLELILDERTRELVTEEHRRHTLVRLGLLYDRAIIYNKGAAQFMQPYHVKLPIPQTVIDANSGAPMDQNFGYN